jgi:diaminohydroxyphosphoribosylaminopyrimidine deaminase/5-amino-6-(5-phosphoribosylamino)uracil reductase
MMVYMEQALSLAKLATGQVSPNPAVGAVIVRDGEVVGQGYTQPPTQPHAEIVALTQAGDRAKGGILYVTLEPCCHQGRTPPCTKAIIKAGIKEVHLAMIDPNPIVNGKGKAELEKAGIKTYTGQGEDVAREINEAYVKYITTGMPFITVKFALSLDGKIATRTGESRWISGEESRKYVHFLRYASDAIMVGVSTVVIDDPSLTTKCCGGRGGTAMKQPLRVVIDTTGRTPLTARIFRQPGQTLLAQGKVKKAMRTAYAKVGAETLELPTNEQGFVEIKSLLQAMGKRGITSVLSEGGGTLLGSLFDNGLVDKVVAFIAPIIIGGTDVKTPVSGRGVDKITDALRLKQVKIERFGNDVMICGYTK